MFTFLNDLGVDWHLLIAQIVNFVILLWILNRFLYKPLLKKIEKDEQTMALAQGAMKQAKKEEGDISTKNGKELAQAKKTARQIIKEAEDIAQNIKSQTQIEVAKERLLALSQINTNSAKLTHEALQKKKKG